MRSQYTVRHLDAMWGFVACYEYFQSHGMDELLLPTEKRIFAKLTGVYRKLSPEDRNAKETQEARRVQWKIACDLKKRKMMSEKLWARVLLFQKVPRAYCLK